MNKLQHFPESSSQYLDHPSHAKPGISPLPARLAVVTTLSNPLRWRSRYSNYWKFEKHVADSGAKLYTCEVAFGARAFEVTEPGNPQHLQLRTSDELWTKENAENLMIQRVTEDYIACIDADLVFSRTDWAQETLHQLQHYPIVQMYSHLQDVNADAQPVGAVAVSAMYLRTKITEANESTSIPKPLYGKGESAQDSVVKRLGWGCPGGAWAYRRKTLDDLGGVIDWIVVGSADYYMVKALFGEVEEVLRPEYSFEYNQLAREWQTRAITAVQKNVGIMPGLLTHYWHGPKQQRGYELRPQVLAATKFNPLRDIKKDAQGLYTLAGVNIPLRDALLSLARTRNEDGQ